MTGNSYERSHLVGAARPDPRTLAMRPAALSASERGNPARADHIDGWRGRPVTADALRDTSAASLAIESRRTLARDLARDAVTLPAARPQGIDHGDNVSFPGGPKVHPPGRLKLGRQPARDAKSKQRGLSFTALQTNSRNEKNA